MKRWLRRLAPVWGMCIGAACSPAVDWREMRPEGAQLAMSMPCRPASHEREMVLAEQRIAIRLFACDAHGATFALGHAALSDPVQAGRVLAALGETARRNVQGTLEREEPAAVRGMTPHDTARHLRLVGKLPDGRPVNSWVTVFAYGPHVYQATVIGPVVDEALASHFMSALAVRP